MEPLPHPWLNDEGFSGRGTPTADREDAQNIHVRTITPSATMSSPNIRLPTGTRPGSPVRAAACSGSGSNPLTMRASRRGGRANTDDTAPSGAEDDGGNTQRRTPGALLNGQVFHGEPENVLPEEPTVDAILVFITAGDEAEASTIAEALLRERLVACVNQVSGVESRFWWQGNLDSAREVLLLAKTRRELWERVVETVRAHHSYEVFEAIAVPIVEGSAEYLSWIAETATG
jgi:periplasmic divalent cation tolerance protein